MLLGIFLLALLHVDPDEDAKDSQNHNPRSLLHGGNGDQDCQEVHHCQEGDDHDDEEDDESLR